jgi:RES domain-containing protein
MPARRRFQAELALIRGVPWSGKCFRVVELEAFLQAKMPSLLFDLGPKISRDGQRFSPPNKHRGLYTSTELVTAGSEFADEKAAWIAGDCAKHVTFDMDVKLASVLDLTAPTIRRALKTSKAEIQSAWLGYADLNGGTWPSTWDLGHAVFASEAYDGILFPSTNNSSGSCLLVFTERIVAGKTHVIIYRQDGSEWERLP